jgi:hypothetical protein
LEEKSKGNRDAVRRSGISETSQLSNPAFNGTNMLENRRARQDQRIDTGKMASERTKLPVLSDLTRLPHFPDGLISSGQ